MKAWLRGNDGFRLIVGVWLLVAVLVAMLVPGGAARAQSTYPTAAGSNVKVPGTVPLQCNSSGQACAPVSASNPAGPNQVVGNVASGAADSGNPVKTGGVIRTGATPATYVNGNRADANMDAFGNLVTALAGVATSPDTAVTTTIYSYNRDTYGGFGPIAVGGQVWDGTQHRAQRGDANGAVTQPALSSTFWNYAAVSGGIVSSTADVAVKAAGGASVRNYVCTIDISHALLSAASEVVLKDGATTIWRGLVQTAATDVGGGAGKVTFAPCLRGTANTAVNFAMITSATGGVYVNLTGYTGS